MKTLQIDPAPEQFQSEPGGQTLILSREDIDTIKGLAGFARIKIKIAPRQWSAREDALLAQALDAQLGIALRAAGVKKALVPAASEMLRDEFAWDEDTGAFYVADENDQWVLSTGSGPNTYKTIEERAAEFAADPKNADFLDKTK
jgi:hypothetical protein